MNPGTERDIVLITGGSGFIGQYVARRLYDTDAGHIRIVDIAPAPPARGSFYHEFIRGNVCDLELCRRVMKGVKTVLHFAATMGGMGTIHESNDFVIYQENHTMTTNLARAAIEAGVSKFFYASSACVYPEELQNDSDLDVSLCEADAWAHFPPQSQGLYGLEKLNSEFVLLTLASKMEVRIARFHNVFGPGGAWHSGREKAPAAMLRKAVALKMLQDPNAASFEIWGDGKQRRSFLWIEDAVDGIVKLLSSSSRSPINIGSDKSVTISDLALLALRSVGVDPDSVTFRYDLTKPVGVASRNSDNRMASAKLGWEPTTMLEDGMHQTAMWIKEEAEKMVSRCSDAAAADTLLRRLLESKIVHLESEIITFGLLVPITSRGGDPEECLRSLKRFAQSVSRTTWRDTHALGGVSFRVVVYLGIDHDDDFLLPTKGIHKAESILHNETISNVTTVILNRPKGHVCSMWRDCARQAWQDECDYMVLMGDDVYLQDEGWMRDAHDEFARLASEQGVPLGFGCVAFTDTTFPGMSTFPVIHRTHLDIFNGEVVPEIFVNQDGDPFLFQLYRRWGCSTMFSSRISNTVGGEDNARYKKEHAKDWTFETLDDAVSTAQRWLKSRCAAVEKVTLDVVVPSYRVLDTSLDAILALKPSDTCTVMFIIIIDDPKSSQISALNSKYAHRADVRIRVNPSNLGASESRNRGMRESSANWIHFLDDDIMPEPDLIVQTEKIIRAHPTAAGFVGNVKFPCADTVFKAAVHLAGVTYFWDIAKKLDDDLPWGVTASLIARRNVRDGVTYDPSYPKTGGGEDIDFCRQKREFSIKNGGEGFVAAPDAVVTHPWWHDGSRSYWRFYMWSVGDSALVKRYPQYAYWDVSPNSAELILISGSVVAIALVFAKWDVAFMALRASVAVIVANVAHDCYRHLIGHPDRHAMMYTNVEGLWWMLAVMESAFIRMFSEMGRVRGLLGRGEWTLLGHRFDWFTGHPQMGNGPKREERMNSFQRFILSIIFLWTSTVF